MGVYVMKLSWKKSIATAVTALVLASPLAPVPAKAEAAGLLEGVIAGVAMGSYVNSYYGKINDENQAEMLKQTQEQTGVYHDAAANARLQNIVDRLTATGLFEHEFAVYANPDESFNAFCTIGRVISVNKGALDILDDDELASVLAHEMQHGEDNHCVKGASKSVALSALASFALDDSDVLQYLMGAVTVNYINNEMFTMSQEKNADKYAFKYVTAAGFNPGGPASAMAKLRSEVGDLWVEGLTRAINPNNHPKTTDRIEKFGKQLYEYSDKHVKVEDEKTVKVNGVEIITPVATQTYLTEQRAYQIAGNVARLYANDAKPTAKASVQGSSVYVGSQFIMNTQSGDITADAVASALNKAFAKD